MTEREGFAPSYLYLGKVHAQSVHLHVRLSTPVGCSTVCPLICLYYLITVLLESWLMVYRPTLVNLFLLLLGLKGTLTG